MSQKLGGGKRFVADGHFIHVADKTIIPVEKTANGDWVNIVGDNRGIVGRRSDVNPVDV